MKQSSNRNSATSSSTLSNSKLDMAAIREARVRQFANLAANKNIIDDSAADTIDHNNTLDNNDENDNQQ